MTFSPNSTLHKPKPPKLRRIDTSDSILGSPSRQTSKISLSKEFLAPLESNSKNLTMSPETLCRPIENLSKLSCHSAVSVPELSRPGPDLSRKLVNPILTNHPIQPPNQVLLNNGSAGITPSPTTLSLDSIFKVSTIIPSFLYLGPEPSRDSDFEDLKRLGIKVILNVAAECPKPDILDKDNFIDRYHQIPLRDFLEEDGIQAAIQKSNQILDHAFLFQLPTYVHCKAGKSRSVTMVLAFLIHRYRWNLKQSYAHVSERRKGVCPNIGFLAELMNFEEREIGSKSRGVAGTPTNKTGRSASHHFSCPSHQITPPKYEHDAENIQERNKIEDDGSRIGFHGYSINGLGSSSHNHHSHSNSIDPRRHHGIRVRSVALGSKTDFFSSLIQSSQLKDEHNRQDSLENMNLLAHDTLAAPVDPINKQVVVNESSLL